MHTINQNQQTFNENYKVIKFKFVSIFIFRVCFLSYMIIHAYHSISNQRFVLISLVISNLLYVCFCLSSHCYLWLVLWNLQFSVVSVLSRSEFMVLCVNTLIYSAFICNCFKELLSE